MKFSSKPAPLVRRRYDRMARFYDLIEGAMEFFVEKEYRTRLNSMVKGPRVLEVGLGTGRNIPYYQTGISYTGIDLSPKMLSRAIRRAEYAQRDMDFLVMDAENLGFENSSFDTVLASFVFCSVPDPVKTLGELRRVCKQDGRLIVIEHVRPGGRFMSALFDLLNPIMLWTIADNINRDTISNIKEAGWEIRSLTKLSSDIIWLIEARPLSNSCL